jgi:hypothetical protein
VDLWTRVAKSHFIGLDCRTPLGGLCPQIDGYGGFRRAHLCFYLTVCVWFQRERFEALLAVNTMEHAFSFHDVGGEYHELRDMWISNGGSICGDEKLAG